MANYREQFARAIQEQGSATANDPIYQQYEAELNKPQQRNLAPTMALIDSLTGSQLSQAVPKEESQKEKLGQLLQMRQAQQNQKLSGLGKLASMQSQSEDKNAQRAFQQQMYDLQLAKARMKSQAPAKMGSEDKKALGFTGSLLSDIPKYREALKNGGLRPGIWASAAGNTPTMALRQQLIENYGRLQSGGAISGDEEKRFGSLFGDWQDDPKILEQKLNQMEEEIKRKHGLYGGAAQTTRAPAAPSFDPMNATEAELDLYLTSQGR